MTIKLAINGYGRIGRNVLRAIYESGRQHPRTPRRPGPYRAYFAAISAAVMSSMRLEEPHSLSYQASTFTSVPPVTLVSVLS